mmetsp:Transcript_11035/g.23658  ORF Transcript_11035/g.23658 Transcript_11035/m.23658 type:complete len:247 (+) Transcript_11035:718-1458(+)
MKSSSSSSWKLMSSIGSGPTSMGMPRGDCAQLPRMLCARLIGRLTVRLTGRLPPPPATPLSRSLPTSEFILELGVEPDASTPAAAFLLVELGMLGVPNEAPPSAAETTTYTTPPPPFPTPPPPVPPPLPPLSSRSRSSPIPPPRARASPSASTRSINSTSSCRSSLFSPSLSALSYRDSCSSRSRSPCSCSSCLSRCCSSLWHSIKSAAVLAERRASGLVGGELCDEIRRTTGGASSTLLMLRDAA